MNIKTLEIKDVKINIEYKHNNIDKKIEIDECYSEKIKEELTRIILEHESIKEKD